MRQLLKGTSEILLRTVILLCVALRNYRRAWNLAFVTSDNNNAQGAPQLKLQTGVCICCTTTRNRKVRGWDVSFLHHVHDLQQRM